MIHVPSITPRESAHIRGALEELGRALAAVAERDSALVGLQERAEDMLWVFDRLPAPGDFYRRVGDEVERVNYSRMLYWQALHRLADGMREQGQQTIGRNEIRVMADLAEAVARGGVTPDDVPALVEKFRRQYGCR